MAWNWGLADFRPITTHAEWIWHTCHRHYHSVENFVRYDLIDEATGDKVAEGHKASFCLEDSQCDGYYGSRYRCAFHFQGISSNCADSYGSHLDCQWIDVTGVPLGEYVLQVHLNPDRLNVESDYRNNKAFCRIQLIPIYVTSVRVQVNSCWLSGIFTAIIMHPE